MKLPEIDLTYNSMTRYIIDIHLALVLIIVIQYNMDAFENENVKILVFMWSIMVLTYCIVRAMKFQVDKEISSEKESLPAQQEKEVTLTFNISSNQCQRLRNLRENTGLCVEEMAKMALEQYLEIELNRLKDKKEFSDEK